MPRISELTLDQINRRFDALDILQEQFLNVQQRVNNIGQSVDINDPIHAPQTTNNFIFTWTGGAQTLSWPQAFIKDKNWVAQTLASPSIKSSAKGQVHLYTVPAGILSATASTYYWLGWDPIHQKMLAVQDVSTLHGNYNVHIICQVFTGTVGQTGVAGGGGSTSGVDLSGARYKNF
jgi:hypothetical protein